MNDLVLLLLIFVAIACVIAPAAGGFSAWLRGEWLLIRAKTWQGDHLVNPALGTAADDRVAKMVLRQRAYGKRLRRQGRSLLSDKGYVPVLTKTAPAERPPRADKVVPIRKPQRISQ